MRNRTIKNIKVESIRTVVSPSDKHITTYYAWVNFKDLPAGLSLEVNPRKPKMTTSVAKQLIKAVTDSNSAFDINNRGIVITAKSVKYNNKTGILTIDLDDDLHRYGVLDGGHTYKAIIDNRDHTPLDVDKFVKLEIVVGDTLDVSALADARNTSVQVSDVALYELDNKFDFIKRAVAKTPYANDIAYKDNDKKNIPIINLIRLLYAFNIKKFPNDAQIPSASYSGKAMVFKDYRAEYDETPNIYKQLALELPTLVNLYETIEREIGDKYREFKLEDGIKGSFGSVRGVEVGGKTEYTKQKIDYNVSIGFIMPIFGAFRALLSWDKDQRKVIWAYDPIKMWERVGTRLVQNTFDMNITPQQTGVNKTLWQANYRIVDSARKDVLIETLLENTKKLQSA